MLIVVAPGNRQRRCLNRDRLIRGQQTKFRIGARSGPFHESESCDKSPRHPHAANRKVVNRTLCLCAPQRILWHLEFTHAVMHGAE